MKNFFIAVCCILFLLSCSRKTVPPKPNTVLENNNNNYADTANSNNNINMPVDSTVTTSNSSALVMIIADGYGRLITPQENLPPDAIVKYNSLQLSKGFTAQQRANLQARYKTVLPRVLYVPQVYALSSLKGSYYVYRKKFWYWKKSDGLFYLDQKYYQ